MKQTAIASELLRIAREVLALRITVDENYVRGLKHMMASDIRKLEGAISSPEDVKAIHGLVVDVENKWEDIFYQVLLNKEMAKLSGGGDIDYLAKELQTSAWDAVLSFHDINYQLESWPDRNSKYPDNFMREKKYVFDKIKRAARKAYDDALILVQSRAEEARAIDFGEKVTVGEFILVPEGGIEEDRMARAAEVVKQAQSLIGRAGFTKVLSRMIVNVTNKSKAGLVAAEYQPSKDSINLLPLGVRTESLVHELGHRNWYQFLSSGSREYWQAAFEGDLTEMTSADVEEIIERVRKIKKDKEDLIQLPWATEQAISDYESAHKEDPLTPYKVVYFKDNIHHHDKFDFWAESWRTDLVGQKVMKNMVSDYANTNEKEAYAEVFMHYVMGKPIPPEVRYWFEKVSL